MSFLAKRILMFLLKTSNTQVRLSFETRPGHALNKIEYRSTRKASLEAIFILEALFQISILWVKTLF